MKTMEERMKEVVEMLRKESQSRDGFYAGEQERAIAAGQREVYSTIAGIIEAALED